MENPNQQSQPKYMPHLVLLTSLFFMWGFITVLNDILIPHLKNIFELSYTGAMLIQFTFFTMYFLVSIPAGFIIKKVGYKKGIIIGLTITGIGAALFYPASIKLIYPLFLVAFGTLAAGITILQVAANPYVAILGRPETASGRLNMTQAFNSLGTTLAPLLGSLLILGSSTYFPFANKDDFKNNAFVEKAEAAFQEEYKESPSSYLIDKRKNLWFEYSEGQYVKYDFKKFTEYKYIDNPVDESATGFLVKSENNIDSILVMNKSSFSTFRNHEIKSVQKPYILITATLFLIALVFFMAKLPKIKAETETQVASSAWQYRHLVLGAIAIFLYVGAEVAIGSFLVSYLGESYIAGMPEREAGRYIALYWGGAMIGRFLGAISLSGINKKSIQYLLFFVVGIFAFFLGWYLTHEIRLAFIFVGFVIFNMLAFFVGKNVPHKTLAVFAAIIIVLVSTTILTTGQFAVWSVLSVGMFNSIMFPTIFTLAIKDLGPNTSQGSGILCAAIVGGAVIPILMGVLADNIGIHYSFIITILCYAFILYYGLRGYKSEIY